MTLDSSAGASRMGLQTGDILNLLPNGELYAVRPSIGVPYLFLNIKSLVIDHLNIWDLQYNRYSTFSGVILPNQNATYGDIAVYDGQVLVTGFAYGFDFVLRLDLRQGFVSSAKVILSSLGQTDSEQPSGLAINDQGIALTTLPFSREGVPARRCRSRSSSGSTSTAAAAPCPWPWRPRTARCSRWTAGA